jgi:antitoxin ParD1/3/4
LAIFAIAAIFAVMTTTMNISLPDSMKAFVDERVKSRGYGSHSEYLRDLVRKDELEASKDALRAMVAEGLSSPPGLPWGEFKAELMARAQATQPKPAKRQK